MSDEAQSDANEFTGRDWVLAEINTWLADRESPTMLIVGGPGAGKSMLAAQLARIGRGEVPAAGEALNRGWVHHAHFCRALAPQTIDPLGLVAAIAQILAGRSPDYLRALGELASQPLELHGHVEVEYAVQSVVAAVGTVHLGERSAVAAFNRTVLMPVADAAAPNGALLDDLVLLVDALDEALSFAGGETIPSILRTIVQAELPLRIRLLMTSRLHDDAIRGLDAKTLDLEADAPDPRADVRAYACRRLQRLDEPGRSAVARRVAESGGGNFLYARHVLDELEGHAALDPAALDLPAGLDAHYARFLNREREQDPQHWRSHGRPVLSALAVARGAGLPRSDLAGAAGLRDSELDLALRSFRQYTTGPWPAGPLRVFHESLRAFVFSTDDSDLRIYPEEANHDVARFLLEEYGTEWPAADPEGHDGLTYALAHLAAHMTEAVAASSGSSRRRALVAELTALLTDPSFLAAKTGALGIDATASDLRAAADAAASDDSTLVQLRRTVDLTAQYLRVWNPVVEPAFFLQQLGARAAQLGLAELAARSVELLERSGVTHLALRWSAVEDSPTLERVMTGHDAGVLGVAATDTGEVLSTGWDCSLRVWDLETGVPREVLTGHEWYVEALAATADGSRAISGSQEGAILLWELRNGLVYALHAHSHAVTGLAIATDGMRAVSGSADATVRVWDLVSRDVQHVLTGHEGTVHAVALSTDGRTAASGADDGTVRIWDIESGCAQHVLSGHEAAVRALAFTPNDSLLVSGSDDRAVRTWDPRSARCEAVMIGHEKEVRTIAIDRSGSTVATGSDDGTIRLWNLPAGTLRQVLVGHSGWVQALAWAPGRRIVSGASDRTVRVWRPDAANPNMETARGYIAAVAISKLGRVVVGAEDGGVSVWDIEQGRLIRLLGAHDAAVTDLVCWRECAISSSMDGSVRIWDLDGGTLERVLDDYSGQVACLAVSEAGELAVGCDDSHVRVHELSTGALIREISTMLMPPGPQSLALTPGGLLVVGADRGTHAAIDFRSGEGATQRFRTHSDGFMAGSVQALAVTPEGLLLSGSDTHLRIYDATAGRMLDEVESSDRGTVMAVAPLGALAAFGGQDGLLQVYSRESKTLVARAHTDAAITSIGVDPWRRRLVTGDLGGQLSAWDFVGK